MKYSIIFNKIDNGKLISWIDSNSFETEEEANEHAVKMSHTWWEKNETVSWMVFYHVGKWKTEY